MSAFAAFSRFTPLTPETVLDLQAKIDKANPQAIVSAFTYLSWSTYGLQISFAEHLATHSVVFAATISDAYWDYTSILFKHKMTQDIVERHLVLAPVSADDNTFMMALNAQIAATMEACGPDCAGVFIDNLMAQQINLIDLQHYTVGRVYTTNTNYLYPRWRLASLSGRRLQKRRNHLNAYLKKYVHKTKVLPIKTFSKNEILTFLEKWGREYGQRKFAAELLLAQMVFPHLKTGAVTGSGLVYADELIGITLSVNHGPYAEILLEHANKSIRGSYQYLLTQNLINNHATAVIVDRQDDMWNADLAQAKRLYRPCCIVQKHFVLVQRR